MEFCIFIARAHRTGQGRLARAPHEAARLRQPGIHPARMKKIYLVPLAFALLTACQTPPVATVAERSNIAVRQPPFTPDSGTIAVRCGLLIDGVASLARI